MQARSVVATLFFSKDDVSETLPLLQPSVLGVKEQNERVKLLLTASEYFRTTFWERGRGSRPSMTTSALT